MKSKEELINKKYDGWYRVKTMEELISEYKGIIKKIEELDELLEPYTTELNSSPKTIHGFHGYEEAMIVFAKEYVQFCESQFFGSNFEYNIVNQVNLDFAIRSLLHNGLEENYKKHEIDLQALQGKLISSCKEIRDLNAYTQKKENLESSIKRLFENVKLPDCKAEDSIFWSGAHCFVKLKDGLKCIYCGFSTKDYDLTKEELEIFTQSIKKNGSVILKNATEDDLPLIENIKKQQKIDMKNYEEKILHGEGEREDRWGNYYYAIDDLYPKMINTIDTAHKMDSKIYTNSDGKIVHNPKYLIEEKTKELMDEVDELISKEEALGDGSNEDLIKEYKIKKFEILILSGKPISEIFSELDNEKDKEYFVMAYGNLNNQEYRIKSGYFEDERKALWYDCVTANPEINKRLLKIKEQNKDSNK